MHEHIKGQFEPKQPQAVTLANPFRIPLHQKKRSKKSVKDSVCIGAIRELFLTFGL